MAFNSKKFLKSLFFAFIASLIIKAFIIDAYLIPSASMENTLLIGDYLLINKTAYSISTPHAIPLLNIWVTSYPIINFKKPERGDVIVFKFPGMPNELNPVEESSYIKRVVGLPGDTVNIINGKVFVNRIEIPFPENAIIPDTKKEKFSAQDSRIFPNNKGWDNDNFGPLVVPYKDETIPIEHSSIDFWGPLINREYDSKTVSIEGSVIHVNKMPIRNYLIKKDYYFVLGDNRENSMDSRYWGFVPEDYIIGKAFVIYWSWDQFTKVNNTVDFFKPLRLNRIFKIIN